MTSIPAAEFVSRLSQPGHLFFHHVIWLPIKAFRNWGMGHREISALEAEGVIGFFIHHIFYFDPFHFLTVVYTHNPGNMDSMDLLLGGTVRALHRHYYTRLAQHWAAAAISLSLFY